MKTIDLTEADKNKMRDLNAKNNWGIDYDTLINLVESHKKHRNKNPYQCALIEYRLIDINFHKEVSLLNAGKYEELKTILEED